MSFAKFQSLSVSCIFKEEAFSFCILSSKLVVYFRVYSLFRYIILHYRVAFHIYTHSQSEIRTPASKMISVTSYKSIKFTNILKELCTKLHINTNTIAIHILRCILCFRYDFIKLRAAFTDLRWANIRFPTHTIKQSKEKHRVSAGREGSWRDVLHMNKWSTWEMTCA